MQLLWKSRLSLCVKTSFRGAKGDTHFRPAPYRAEMTEVTDSETQPFVSLGPRYSDPMFSAARFAGIGPGGRCPFK